MKQLVRAGIVDNWKDGKKVMYRISDENIYEILDTISGILRKRAAQQKKMLEVEVY